MVDLALLMAEHAEIEALAARLLIEIAAPAPRASLSAIRWRLNYVLMVHLAKEDKLLYPELQRREITREVAARMVVEAGGLAKAYLDYGRAWPIARVESDWAGFGAATRAMITALRERGAREERDLFQRAALPEPPRG